MLTIKRFILILAIGTSYPFNSHGQQFDESFGPVLKGIGWVTSIDETPEGHILVAGNFDYLENTESGALLKLDRNGNLAPAFNKVYSDQPIDKVFSLSEGKILVFGKFTRINGQNIHQLARLNADGTIDDTFSHSVTAEIHTVDLQADEKIIIGTGTNALNIKRLTASGEVDGTFITPSLFVYSALNLTIGPDDKIYIHDSEKIQRLNSDGNTDLSFQSLSATNGQMFIVRPLMDGTIMIGGGFKKYGSQDVSGLIKVDAQGNLISSFIGPSFTHAIAEMADGKILTAGNEGKVYLFTANGSASELVTNNFFGIIQDLMETQDHKILISRWFAHTNVVDLGAVALFDAPFNPNSNFKPSINRAPRYSRNNMSILPSGKIVLGGFDFSFETFNNIPTNFVKINPDGSLDGEFAHPLAIQSQIMALEVGNNKILVSGFLHLPQGLRYLTRLNADGSLDDQFKINFGPNSITNRIRFRGSTILLGGNFTSFDGVPTQSFVILDYQGKIKQTFNDLPPGSDIQDFDVQSDGSIVAVGTFPYSGGLKWIVKLSPQGNTISGFNAIIENPSCVRVDAQDRVYVGGKFLDGKLIKRFTPSGQTDLTFNPGNLQAASLSHVAVIEFLPTNQLAIGGNFRTFNGAEVGGFIMLNKDDTGFSTPTPGLSPSSIIGQLKYFGSTVYLGGKLSFQDGQKVIGLGKLGLDTDKIVKPGPPSNFRIAAEIENKTELAWADKTDMEDGYEIEILESEDDAYKLILSTTANNDGAIDSVYQIKEETSYRIRAVNAKGASDYVYLDEPDFTPLAPDGLMALLVNDTDIQLTWNDNSLDEHGFLLERSIDTQTDFENLTVTDSDVTEFIDTGVKSGHSYYYRLSAFNDYGYSSSVITQTTIVTGLTKRDSHFSFSPNPVSTQLNISTDTTPVNIVVMNQLGQALVNLIAHKNEIDIDFSSFPSGVYILKFASNSRTESHLIIKK